MPQELFVKMGATTTQRHMQSDQPGAGSRDRGARCWSQLPRGAEATGQSGVGAQPRPLSAETHRQAVPGVRVLFSPPAGTVILVVSPIAHRGPHASIAHRAVAPTLGMAVGSFHGQFHAVVLLVIQVRT